MLVLDALETRSAFEQLSAGSPITLKLALERLGPFEEVRLALASGARSIALTKASLLQVGGQPAVPLTIERARAFALARLSTLAQRAIARADGLPPLLAHAESLSADDWREDVEKRAVEFANLINAQVRRRSLADAQACFALFMAKVRPHLRAEQFATIEYIASNMLALHRQDPTVFAAVWQDCLSGDQNLPRLKDARLFFNLACYYGYRRDKQRMLQFAQRALDGGKRPDDLRRDEDLTAFRADRDFLALLAKYERAEP